MGGSILLYLASVVYLTTAFPLNNTTPLPSFLQVCRRSDLNLNSCVKDSINTLIKNVKSGWEDLGLPPTDPLEVPLVDLSTDSSNLTLQLILKDMTILGLADTNVISVKANLEDHKFEVASRTPFFALRGSFVSEGGVLSFPLSSAGVFDVNLTDVTAVWIIYFREIMHEDGGPTFLNIDYTALDVIPSDIRFRFGHYLDGDNELGEAMNIFLNGNSHEVFNDVKPRINKLIGTMLSELGNRVLSSFPANVLLPQ